MIVNHVGVADGIRRLAVPYAVGILADQLLGIVDTAVMGVIGVDALAVVGALTTVMAAIIITFEGFGSGVRILGAQAIGAQRYDRFGEVARAALVVPITAALAVALAALAWSHLLTHALLGALPGADAGATYFTLRALSLVAIAVDLVLVNAASAAGDARIFPRLIAVINLVHLPLVLVLALGIGTGRPLGIIGAGISSLVAEFAGMTFAIVAVARQPQLRIFASARIDAALAARIARLSLPEVAYLGLVLAPDVVFVALIAPLGAATLGAFRVMSIVNDATWALPGGLSSAAQTVIGQRLGAHDVRGAFTYFHRMRRFGVIACAVGALVIAALGWPIAVAITFNPAIAAVTALPLLVYQANLPLKGWAMLSLAPIRAAGDTRFTMIVGIGAVCVVVPIAIVAIRIGHAGIFGVGIAWFAGWLAWCVLVAIRLRRLDWQRASLAL